MGSDLTNNVYFLFVTDSSSSFILVVSLLCTFNTVFTALKGSLAGH